VAFDNAIS